MSNGSNLVVLEVKRPDEALFKSSEAILEAARNQKIATAEMAIAAGEDLKAVKALAKEIEAKRTAITGPLNKALKEVNALFKPAKTWLKEAEGLLKGKILEFQNEQERIAREAQAKAEAEARKEREKLERKAKLAAVVGLDSKAEELREEAETQIAPVVTSAAPKIAGVSVRETWKAKVTNKRKFIRHVSERADLLPLVSINQSDLNTMARLYKDELDLPGVEVFKEASVVARGGS